MKENSEDEEALIKIQHDWAEARMKGDSSFTRRLEAPDCTVVWPDGSIVNKGEDLESMIGDIVFTEFKIDDLQVRLYGDTGIVVGQGTIKAHEGKQNLLGGKFVWTDTFIKQDGAWKVVAITSNSSLKEIIVNNRRYPYEQIHNGLRGGTRNSAFYCRYCGPCVGR